MSNLTAFVTQVPFGTFSIEGLMDEKGNYFVAVTQLVSLNLLGDGDNQDRHRHASRSLKRLMGEDFKSAQLKTEFNKNITNAVTLSDFEKVLAKLDRLGNKAAQELRDDMIGLSLHQLFCDAFGVKFEVEDRSKWLKYRQVHRKAFHPKYTSWLKFDGITDGKDYAKEVNRLKLCANLPLKPVEQYDTDEMWLFNEAESNYNMARKLGHSHAESLRYL